MANIAISYRREDTAWITGRISDRLKNHYQTPTTSNRTESSTVFLDYDSIPLGADFREYINTTFKKCDILLAIIGPNWIGSGSSDKPRIMNENDWIRIEIETALSNNIPIIPVLIDRSPMPMASQLPESLHALSYRQAAVVDTQIDFNIHIDRLIRQIDRLTKFEIAQPTSHIAGENSEPVRQQGHQIVKLFNTPLKVARNFAVAASLGIVSAWYFYQPHVERNEIPAPAPIYYKYHSTPLGLTLSFPNNILTLDTTQESSKRLIIRSGDGQPAITVSRSEIPFHKNPRFGRSNEIEHLSRMNVIVTYVAPADEANWRNWYIISGISHGMEFYYRRWYCTGSMLSIEFTYIKKLAPLYDDVIPKMINSLSFDQVADDGTCS